jgi:putative hydrolase of HD superfamily
MAAKKTIAATYRQLAQFVYESGIHSRTPRSGFWFLGSGQQSVAEHLFRTAFITMALCHLEPKADRNKAILMSLVHDFGEGRTSDLNYVHQKYGRLAEARAMEDIAETVPFGAEMHALFKEEQARETLEAKLVKDADQLEWIASMREEEAKGNTKAGGWAAIAFKRLKTPAGQRLGKELMKTHPDAWWFDAKDQWWVDRKVTQKGRKSTTKKQVK